MNKLKLSRLCTAVDNYYKKALVTQTDGSEPPVDPKFLSRIEQSSATPATPAAPAYKSPPGYEGPIDRRVQQALVNMHKDLGKSGPKHDGVDGSLGQKTRAALNEFKASSPHTQAMKDPELFNYIIQYFYK